MKIGWGSIILKGNIDLNGNNLGLVSADRIIVSGQITGTGNVFAAIDGSIRESSIIFGGPTGNTFSGSLTVYQSYPQIGQVVFDKQSGAVVNDALVIGDEQSVHRAVCKLARSHQIGDNAKVCVVRGGQFLLEGHTETIGSLCLTNCALDTTPSLVDTGDATLSLQADITAVNNSTNPVPVIKGQLGLPPGNHTIHTMGSQDFALNIEASIIGDGGFTKTGDRGLLLAGTNSFNGDAVLREGVVDVNNANALGSTSGVTIMDGAELDVREAAIGGETLLVNRGSYTQGALPGALLVNIGTSSWAEPITLGTNLNVVGWEMTFSGPISGSGGIGFSGWISGAGTPFGTVQFAGTEANTYAGPTVAWGTLLAFNKPSGVSAFGGALVVGNGGGSSSEARWLQNYQRVGADVTLFSDGLVNLNNHADDFGTITFNGGTISTGTGELGVYGLVTVNPSGVEATIDGRLGLPSGFHEFRVGDGSPLIDLAVNAVVVGSGHLRKTGLGQMWLSASNTYTGLTVVDEGALVAFNADALGASGTGTTVNDGASLILNATGATVREPIALSGTGDGRYGALNVFGLVTLRNPFPSIFACLDLTTNGTIRVESGGVLTADGFISGIGPLTKTGPGALVFANANTNSYSGDTIAREGTLELRKPNFAVAVPGDLVIGPAPFNSSAVVAHCGLK